MAETPSLIPTLAQRLKAETKTLHTAAERSRFMAALLRGQIGRAPYCAMLRNLHAIYAALEPALAGQAQHPIIAPVFLPVLARAEALADDLRTLHGADWAAAFELLPSSLRYVAHLHAIAAAQPERLLAHAYVRYLGDLSGGQMLRRIVAASLGLPLSHAAGCGTAFYDFGDAASTQALTLAFRAGLSGVVVDEDGAAAIVAEARLAFEWHHRLFDELAWAAGLFNLQQAASEVRG